MVILSFGLLGPARATSPRSRRCPPSSRPIPSALYVILGATHPDLLLREGEAYRESLGRPPRPLGVTDHVRFIDRFVGRRRARDVARGGRHLRHPVPEPGPDRVRDAVLRDGRRQGDRVDALRLRPGAPGQGPRPPRRPGILGGARRRRSSSSLGDPELRASYGRRAYAYSRGHGLVRRSGPSTRRIFARAALPGACHPCGRSRSSRPSVADRPLHPVSRRHLAAMTGELGIWQHAIGPVPNEAFGYCTDDVARALTVDLAPRTRARLGGRRGERLALAALPARRVRSRRPGASGTSATRTARGSTATASEDSHGRAMLALGGALCARDRRRLRRRARGCCSPSRCRRRRG